MKTIERLDNFRRLWGVAVPKVECPADGQIYRWISMFDDSILEHGVRRLRVKILRGEIVASDSAGRYLTAVCGTEVKRRLDGATEKQVAHV